MRPVFKAIVFSGEDKKLLEAIHFLQLYFPASARERKDLLKEVPLKCIPKKHRKQIVKTDNNTSAIDMAKYEFMIYQLIIEQIDAGQLYLEHSLSFKSFAAHLVNNKRWEKKASLLKKVGNNKLLRSADDLLDDLEKELEGLIKQVNERIESGENKGIELKVNGDEISFTLLYPDADKENHQLFKQVSQVSIAEVFQLTQSDCNFMQAFTHIKPYDAKDKLDPKAVMACIIANATHLGINKMARSCDLNYQRMYTQSKNFIRLETLKNANDILVNSIAGLPIFKLWNIHDDVIHASVDGQKFETRLHSFMARYSSKYFGVNKGVVAYTLCANHLPVNAKVISANQHESHHLFDILYNSTNDISIDWLSGDGHSINQVNFALLDFIDKQFAPHFRRINSKADNISGFKSMSHYKDLLIKPKTQFNKRKFKKEWDNIQRIIASLLLGETSQHLIVSKLSSHKRKNATKEALWEYDKLLMSIYLLKYIDNAQIRQNVRRALNRGEAYHKLRRAIANVHGSKFRGKNDKEIEVWNECGRLMANCMIYYNAKLLNALLIKLKKEGNENVIGQLKYISPVAWINMNLYGYYTFEGDKNNPVNIEELAGMINMANAV